MGASIASLCCMVDTNRPLCLCSNAHFRSRFEAAIVSIRRQGENLQGKLGDVQLAPGDELLFDAGAGFDEHAEVVSDNLESVKEDGEQHAREFMFAFSVEGASFFVHDGLALL
jgi:hypothetical protein